MGSRNAIGGVIFELCRWRKFSRKRQTRLLHGLESPYHWVSDEEVANRIREAEEDPSVMISFDEFVDDVKRGGS